MSKFITARVCALLLPAVLLAACSSHVSQQPFIPTSGIESELRATTASTTGNIPLFQVFDYGISPSSASADASRYSTVWGARQSLTKDWMSGNSAIRPLYYVVQETDGNYRARESGGHDIAWWQANHPHWVLYACTPSGTPTNTPAYISQLTDYVTLDFHNLGVAAYQIREAATFAHEHNYGGIAVDEVLLYNVTGTGVGTGYYGCGIQEQKKFVYRYHGVTDPAYATDVLAWLKEAQKLLHNDPVLKTYNLKLFINHPAENPSSPQEQQLLSYLDGVMNETGFTDYGLYQEASRAGLFYVTANWMAYAQAHGIYVLNVNKFGTAPVTPDQLEYSIATFLLTNNGSSALYTGNDYAYGTEQYHSEYQLNYGTPCGPFYGGPSYDPLNPQMWYRKYSNAFVALNAGSLPRPFETAALPAGHQFTDIEGRPVVKPLTVLSNDSYVLLTTNGCN